jgi:hypothetical protein
MGKGWTALDPQTQEQNYRDLSLIAIVWILGTRHAAEVSFGGDWNLLEVLGAG